MTRVFIAAVALAVLLGSPPAFGSCQPLPAQSPVAAPTPDDIPRAQNAWLIDHQGNYFEGKQNHVMGFVQTTPDEQKVWFTINSVPHYTTVYYNRRFRTSATAPWQWAYSRSIPVHWFTSPGSLVVNAVLYSPTAKYSGGYSTAYKYVMYATYQPKACDGLVAGFAMISFSNDGTCWTTPEPLRKEGGPSAECAPDLGTDLVQVESFDAIDTGNNFILLLGIEGNVQTLVDYSNMDSTLTAWGYSNFPDMRQLYMPSTHNVTSAGIVSPAGIASTNLRYKTYSYLINPALAWDAAHGDLYLTRAYPYPFDRYGADVPSLRQQFPKRFYTNPYLLDANGYPSAQEVEGCVPSPAILPNRVQVYKMHLGSLAYANLSQLSTGTWTLVSDIGNNVGYEWQATQQNIAIAAPQTSVGRDYGAASFLRTGSGALQLDGGNAYMFAATQYLSPLSVGPCRATGLERSFLTVVPR
jgi:hypothetical protein